MGFATSVRSAKDKKEIPFSSFEEVVISFSFPKDFKKKKEISFSSLKEISFVSSKDTAKEMDFKETNETPADLNWFPPRPRTSQPARSVEFSGGWRRTGTASIRSPRRSATWRAGWASSKTRKWSWTRAVVISGELLCKPYSFVLISVSCCCVNLIHFTAG